MTAGSDEGVPAAPKHLSKESKTWWRTVVSDYRLEGHHLKLLRLACETWDRIQQARSTLARDGLMVSTESGPKLHPLCKVELDNRTSYARLLRELDLDGVPAVDAKRPPMLRSMRGGK